VVSSPTFAVAKVFRGSIKRSEEGLKKGNKGESMMRISVVGVIQEDKIITLEYQSRVIWIDDKGKHAELCNIIHEIDSETLSTIRLEYYPIFDVKERNKNEEGKADPHPQV
jgi:hypothetical protein